jgi:hypothetical protein
MSVIGICVVYKSGRPTVECVVADGTTDSPELIAGFDLKTDADKVPAQLRALAKALNSKLSGLPVGAAVIRNADVPRTASRKAAPRHRLLIEGALALTCENHTVDSVHLRTGKEIGEALGVGKDDSLKRGKQLDSSRIDAAAAAISGLPKSV